MVKEDNLHQLFDNLATQVNADAALVYRGRYVTTQMLLGIDEAIWSLTIKAGEIVDCEQLEVDQPLPQDAFVLRAPLAEWCAFWSALPPPGSHDLFALLKRRVLSISGNQHPFMANLMYFKTVLAKPRERIV